MNFIESVQTYFSGEKGIAYYAIPIGILLLVIAVSVFRLHWDNLTLRGLVFPMLLMSLGALGLGFGMYIKSNKDITRLETSFAKQPKETIKQEVSRMQKVNGNWIYLKTTWAILILVGLGILFFVSPDLWKGIALGLLLIGALGFFVDVIAEKRGLEYERDLVQILNSVE